PLKCQEELVKKFVQRTGEPFMTQDPLCSYAHVWLIKEAAEQAKSADPKAIRDALAKIDLNTGPAAPPPAPAPTSPAAASARCLSSSSGRTGSPSRWCR